MGGSHLGQAPDPKVSLLQGVGTAPKRLAGDGGVFTKSRVSSKVSPPGETHSTPSLTATTAADKHHGSVPSPLLQEEKKTTTAVFELLWLFIYRDRVE